MPARDGASNKFGVAKARGSRRKLGPFDVDVPAGKGEEDRKEAERLPRIINNAEHHYISGNFYLFGRALMNIMTCSSSSRSYYLFPSIFLLAYFLPPLLPRGISRGRFAERSTCGRIVLDC